MTEGLWITDAELVKRMGCKEARDVIQKYDDTPGSGFPTKQKLWGNRRYWPAVKEYLDFLYAPKLVSGSRRKDHVERVSEG